MEIESVPETRPDNVSTVVDGSQDEIHTFEGSKGTHRQAAPQVASTSTRQRIRAQPNGAIAYATFHKAGTLLKGEWHITQGHQEDSLTNHMKWCSYCFDFAACLLLCTGCRCDVCVNTSQSTRGCAIWQECVDNDDFVFHCKQCTVHWRVPCPISHRPHHPL